MKYAVTAIVSYLLAAPLTSLISLDMRLTEWTNIMTYVFWLFAVVIWGFIMVMVAALFVAIRHTGR